MADEEVPTNMALMAFSDSNVLNDKTCSNTCLKNYETLKTQYDSLRVEFNKFKFDLANYKRGLASVEEQLAFYKKNKKEKESNKIKIDNFENASKSLDKLIGSQISDNNRKGLGFDSYNDVAPPPTGLFAPPSIDLSNSVVLTKSGLVPPNTVSQSSSKAVVPGDPQVALKDTRIFDSGCSRHMIGNKSYLTDYQDYDGGFVAFAGSSKGGKITGKGKIRTGKLDFEDVYFVKEHKFNLFSVSQMCDRKNNVLFTESECLILSLEFKLPDESQVMLKVPRRDNMYSFDLKNVVPSKGLTCLFAKAINDESKMWHRRLGHINFKTINKLVKGNIVRGLPSKIFQNDHSCVACQKGKQHKATCKSKLVNYVYQPLQILHMDLFGPTFVKSIMGKMYCLVVTDDYSRFSWVFFLAKKDETSGILKNFITGIENQLDHKVKIIRCDNGTEFKNYDMNQFCGMKWIKREFSNARTPQQNGVAKRKNRTLIEAAKTMLADLLLPITFWAEAVNTACYVQNR
ncbi:putative ribonuclease H-like domain-containing protein, partial [Tanacetum coccineum]